MLQVKRFDTSASYNSGWIYPIDEDMYIVYNCVFENYIHADSCTDYSNA